MQVIMSGTCASVLEVIGNTPLIELSRIVVQGSGRIFAKLENLNPGSSKKDRIAKRMIEEAERDGKLRPGQTVVELTSGNTGTGLAIVCSIKGYPFVAVMSRGNSPERARMMRALGAEVVLVEQQPGSVPGQVSGGDLDLVEEAARRIAEERKAFRADQFSLTGNFNAHYLFTAQEILEQTGGRIDAFCDFVGTGGSFAGCSAAFKDHDLSIRCFVVEPAGAAILAGREVAEPRHKIQGGGYSMKNLPLLRKDLIDGYIQVTDEEAIAGARMLAAREGIFAGFSSGANLAAALRLHEGEMRGKNIVILICDSGLKYMTTGLWD